MHAAFISRRRNERNAAAFSTHRQAQLGHPGFVKLPLEEYQVLTILTQPRYYASIRGGFPCDEQGFGETAEAYGMAFVQGRAPVDGSSAGAEQNIEMAVSVVDENGNKR